MDIHVKKLTAANDAYRLGNLLMTDEEYDEGIEQLAATVPNHPFLKKVRGPPTIPTEGKVVQLPYYLGSLNKAKTPVELEKWSSKLQKTKGPYLVSEKLDGISGLWSPTLKKLYLSGEDNTGLDVSPWLKHISLSPTSLSSEVPDDVWIRGELIMARSSIPAGRLGRSIVNGIFHHVVPNPAEASKVRFVAYEVIGMDPSLTTKQQMAWLQEWQMWLPWHASMPSLDAAVLTKLLADRRATSEYDMDGLVIKMNQPSPTRVTKGNPTDAIAWKPPNGESKLTTVVAVEWNASATGRLVPRVQIESVNLGGSQINFVTGVHARRITDWQIGPGAKVIIRKGGDVIPVIDSVVTPATVTYPPEGTWEWDLLPGVTVADAVNIKQKTADTTTIVAQFMKMVDKLGWESIGPAQMKAVVAAGYTTVPQLRKASEEALKKLVGPVKGAHLYKTLQTDGWLKATEMDLFVASPICRSGIGRTRLEMLYAVEADYTKWTSATMVAPKGWSPDALKEFQTSWKEFETLRKGDWSFLPYPMPSQASPKQETALQGAAVQQKGTVVFSGFRDKDLEANLLTRGYKVVDAVNSTTRAVLIADKDDPETASSTKIDKARKIPGCVILRRADSTKLV